MTYIPVLKLMKFQKLQSFYLFKHKHSIKYDEVAWQPKKWVSLELVHRKWSSRKWSLVLNDPHVLTFWSVLGAATVSSLLCPWWQGGGGRVCPFSFVSLPHAWTPFLHSLHMSFTIFFIQLTALKVVKRIWLNHQVTTFIGDIYTVRDLPNIMSAIQWKFPTPLYLWIITS